MTSHLVAGTAAVETVVAATSSASLPLVPCVHGSDWVMMLILHWLECLHGSHWWILS